MMKFICTALIIACIIILVAGTMRKQTAPAPASEHRENDSSPIMVAYRSRKWHPFEYTMPPSIIHPNGGDPGFIINSEVRSAVYGSNTRPLPRYVSPCYDLSCVGEVQRGCAYERASEKILYGDVMGLPIDAPPSPDRCVKFGLNGYVYK